MLRSRLLGVLTCSCEEAVASVVERRRDREKGGGDVGNRVPGKETGSDDGFKMVASNVLVLYVNGKRAFFEVRETKAPSVTFWERRELEELLGKLDLFFFFSPSFLLVAKKEGGMF